MDILLSVLTLIGGFIFVVGLSTIAIVGLSIALNELHNQKGD